MNGKIEPNQETDCVSAATENSIWLSDALNREPGASNSNESPKQKITLIRAFKERSRIIRQIDLINRDRAHSGGPSHNHHWCGRG